MKYHVSCLVITFGYKLKAQMELRHLRYFIATAEEENVSRAALKLHVSQPAISRQIHDLEYELGFQLFERNAKSLKLTEAGKKFLADATTILKLTDDAVKNAKAVAENVGGELHVGYAPSLTIQILPQALRAFQEKFPNVRVALHDLSTEEMVSQLREEKLQVALTVRLPAKLLRGLNFEELARYETCIAVAPKHPLAKSKSVSLEQIASEPLIAYNRKDYPEYHKHIEKIFAPVGRTPRIAGEHDGITSLAAAVEAGHGFALVPSCVACMVGPRLKLLPLHPALPPISVVAIWLKENASELVKKFIAAARQNS